MRKTAFYQPMVSGIFRIALNNDTKMYNVIIIIIFLTFLSRGGHGLSFLQNDYREQKIQHTYFKKCACTIYLFVIVTNII